MGARRETDTDDRKILFPFDKRECICMKEAVDLAGVTESTMRNWCNWHGLGRRIGGKWAVSKVALAMYLDGNAAALAAYHTGERTDPAVIAYFEKAGLGRLLDG